MSRRRAAEADARLLAVAGAEDDLDAVVSWTGRVLRGTTSVVLAPDPDLPRGRR